MPFIPVILVLVVTLWWTANITQICSAVAPLVAIVVASTLLLLIGLIVIIGGAVAGAGSGAALMLDLNGWCSCDGAK